MNIHDLEGSTTEIAKADEVYGIRLVDSGHGVIHIEATCVKNRNGPVGAITTTFVLASGSTILYRIARRQT